MLKFYKFFIVLSVVLLATSAYADVKTVSLINNTSCELLDDGSAPISVLIKNINNLRVVPAVPIYSHYYVNGVATLYGELVPYQSGNAAFGPMPGVTPPEPGIILSYSANPKEQIGESIFSQGAVSPGDHIIVDKDTSGRYPNPYLHLLAVDTDPCEQ